VGAEQLMAQTGIAADHFFDILEHLLQQQRIVRLDEGLYISDTVFGEGRGRVVQALADQTSLTTSELKEVLGANRRFAVLFLELLDVMHITRRVGESRTLAS
jgi:selenocysteine-specific elongation factor